MASRRKRKKMRRKGKEPSKKKEEKPNKKPQNSEKKERTGLADFYDKRYKPLLIIPFLLLVGALVVLGWKVSTTGDFIGKDVTLQGGMTVTILTEEKIDTQQLEDELGAEFPDGDVRSRSITELGRQVGLTVDASNVDRDELVASLQDKIQTMGDSYSVETIGPALGASFFNQTARAVWIAFVFMGMVVFLYFGESAMLKTLTTFLSVVAAIVIWNSGTLVMTILSLLLCGCLIYLYIKYSIPSAAVVLAALSDIIITLAVMNLLGINLSTAGIAALLMLIGYSVDTDILLSTRVLKRKEGDVMERMVGAVKTGLTMNVTTLAAITVALFVSQSETITQIMTILLIGLIIDVINTWIQNVGILKLYLEREGRV